MITHGTRIALGLTCKVFTASVLYSQCIGNNRSQGFQKIQLYRENGLVLRCESYVLTASASLTDAHTCNTLVHSRSMFYRVVRGLLRFGWIMLKLVPGILTAPVAYFSPRARTWWWRYTTWVLTSSGPTAIKFAQWAGTRPDLFPESAVKSFRRLHTESVHSYSLQRTERDLDGIYGLSWREWLELTDEAKLIGSGAIAHVCKGRIISGKDKGAEVALKIAHANVREIVEADLDIMAFGSWLVSKTVPFWVSLDVPAATEEFSKFIRSQTDLLTEAQNIVKFSKHFKDHPHIKFPTVFMDKCTRDILVESFEPGVALGEVIKSGSVNVKRKICDLGIRAFLKMLFIDNFVHGDLHPGNILFQCETSPSNHSIITKVCDLNSASQRNFDSGKVVFLDCGLVAQLGPRDERNFLDLMHAVVRGQSMEVGRLMIARSRSSPETVYQPDVFCERVAHLVDTTVTGKSLIFGGLEFGTVIAKLLGIACQHHVRLETDFVSVACALIVLEGVGKQLDPRRNLLWDAEPYIIKQFIRRATQQAYN